MKTAKFVKDVSDNFAGVAHVYQLTPPHKYADGSGDPEGEFDYVVVSALDDDWADETFIFPCDQTGEVISFLEMPGSFKGSANIVRALGKAGYEAEK